MNKWSTNYLVFSYVERQVADHDCAVRSNISPIVRSIVLPFPVITKQDKKCWSSLGFHSCFEVEENQLLIWRPIAIFSFTAISFSAATPPSTISASTSATTWTRIATPVSLFISVFSPFPISRFGPWKCKKKIFNCYLNVEQKCFLTSNYK